MSPNSCLFGDKKYRTTTELHYEIFHILPFLKIFSSHCLLNKTIITLMWLNGGPKSMYTFLVSRLITVRQIGCTESVGSLSRECCSCLRLTPRLVTKSFTLDKMFTALTSSIDPKFSLPLAFCS